MTISAATASGMFSRFVYLAMSAGDRYASDAPRLTVPAAADEIPTPDEELAVLRVTCENCEWYAGPQSANSGAISELPVSEMVCEPDAGVVMTDGPLDDAGEDAPVEVVVDELLLVELLLLQAARARAATEVSAVTARARLPRRPEPRRPGPLYGAGSFIATAVDSFTVRTSDPCGSVPPWAVARSLSPHALRTRAFPPPARGAGTPCGREQLVVTRTGPRRTRRSLLERGARTPGWSRRARPSAPC